MNRERGKGPFAVVADEATGRAAVMDATGAGFCSVDRLDCHGHDLSAAKARARRIAESLNKTEGFGGTQPVPYLAEDGSLRAPEGFGWVANRANEAELVPLVSIRMSPAS